MRIPELDGLRGVAILLILSLHWIVRPYGDVLRAAAPHLWALADLSWCGVDLFFVLSGFLVGGILLDQRRAPNVLRTFYVRRACRILPPYLLLLAAVSLPWAGRPIIARGEIPIGAYLLSIQNFWSASGARVAFPLGPCWSLAIEEQFYLALPLLLLWVFRKRFATFALLVLTVPLLLRCLFFARGGWSAWDFTPCRIDAPFWGVLAAVVIRDERALAFIEAHRSAVRRLAGLGLLAVAAASQLVLAPGGSSILLTFGLSLMGCAFSTAMVAVLLSPQSWAAGALRARSLRFFGRHSYFLYLFHLLVLERMPISAYPLRVAFALAVVLALAVVSWRWLESPFLRLGARMRYQETPGALLETTAA
jgi:peptidoglycan/LPS O-acetylase OafA/YrhL